MRLSPTLFNHRRSGFALLITMVFLAIMLAAYASLMYWTTTNSKITKRNNLFNQAQAAAESATESVLATMMRDFNNQSLNSASTYAAAGNLPSQSGWPVSYLFSDTNGNANSTTVIPIGSIGWSSLPARYNGLQGNGQDWVIASTASPTNAGENLSATINQTVWFGFIPIFQFAIFYNMDLEINPGDTFNVNGKVHSNNNIYATGNGSGTPLTFSDLVEYAGSYSSTRSPLDPSTRSG
ncbi:MAG: type II secretion system protein, partial [Verrucomicrobiae bacterium]